MRQWCHEVIYLTVSHKVFTIYLSHEVIQLVIDKRNRSEKRVISLKKDFNSLNQCGWRNNIVFTGIPDIKQDDQLEETVKFMLSHVDVNLDENIFEN